MRKATEASFRSLRPSETPLEVVDIDVADIYLRVTEAGRIEVHPGAIAAKVRAEHDTLAASPDIGLEHADLDVDDALDLISLLERHHVSRESAPIRGAPEPDLVWQTDPNRMTIRSRSVCHQHQNNINYNIFTRM